MKTQIWKHVRYLLEGLLVLWAMLGIVGLFIGLCWVLLYHPFIGGFVIVPLAAYGLGVALNTKGDTGAYDAEW